MKKLMYKFNQCKINMYKICSPNSPNLITNSKQEQIMKTNVKKNKYY